MTAVVNYGPIKKGQEYVLLEEGFDWYKVRVRGKPVFVSKWVFENE